ncbi:MAG: two-component system, OmpR family, response regulator [Acidimicrobiaceae bacterium]|jgi:DNA-binding response OmpR family regulator|nr:two-component system, OmpR family, response regulator [Acidimicrobiaceae bacterium]
MTDVSVIWWPAEQEQREALAAKHRPRLLLLNGEAAPPIAEDCLEDWVRLPAPEADVKIRVETLAVRAKAHVAPPKIDVDGVLRIDDSWVPLPPVEARITTALLDRFGAVVPREVLTSAGWPEADEPGRNALDVHILRLRRRIQPVRLAIRTIRARGYLLEHAA